MIPEQVIGNYKVIRRIGRGGMGSVYEVESLDLHERFALKTFTYDPKDDDGDVLKNKFLEEGKILARLRHPNIAHVYTLAYDKELELLYFVMDLVLAEDGRPYSVENASFADLEEDTALAWFTDVCEALDYIHSQGIVHRDIKPGNLLVKQDGHIVLTDFGIAKVNAGRMKEEVNPAMTMRIDGNITVLGSNHYMAPEVEQGGEVTPAADAYSLGVMMFEMLTGKWYDKVEDPWALLEGRKYPWKRVLRMFLAADPSERPLGYAAVAKRMPNWKEEVKRKKVELSRPEAVRGKSGKPVLLAAAVVFSVAVISAVVFLNSRKPAAPSVPVPPAPVEIREVQPAADEPVVEEEVVEEAPEPVPEPVVEKTVVPEVKSVPQVTLPPKEPEKAKAEVKLPAHSYSWTFDGLPSGPKEIEFHLVSGAKIIFCAVPSGRFWFSKYCVTSAQCREFQGMKPAEIAGKLESAYPGYPVYCSFAAEQWKAYCEFLTDRYRSQIPSGWSFRLATAEEFDAAFTAGNRKGLEGLPANKFNAGNKKITQRWAETLKKERRQLFKGMDARGFIIAEDVCLGGITDSNALGIHDFWLDGWHQFVTDPATGKVILRSGRKNRAPSPDGVRSRAHIVLAAPAR